MAVNYLAGGWLKISNFPAALAGGEKKIRKNNYSYVHLITSCSQSILMKHSSGGFIYSGMGF